MQRIDTEIAVIGGGIVGSSAALFLQKLGHEVTIIERDLCGSRSSGINFGGVRRQGRAECQLPLAQKAHKIWANLEQIVGDKCEYERSGHFKIARSDEDMVALEAYKNMSDAYGLELQLLTGDALKTLCPWLSDKAIGGSLCPEDGQANPRLVAPAFAFAAKQTGVTIYERTEILEVTHSGHEFQLVTNQNQTIHAEIVINCAGAWANRFTDNFGDNVPMTHGNPSMVVTEPIPYFFPLSLGVQGGSVYCRQVKRGNVVFGGGRGYELDETRARPSHMSITHVLPQAIDLLPQLKHANIIRTWSGVEGYLPDKQPILCASKNQSGLFHGFGFAGAGFQIGPAAGEVLAELIHYGRTDIALDAFSINRFTA